MLKKIKGFKESEIGNHLYKNLQRPRQNACSHKSTKCNVALIAISTLKGHSCRLTYEGSEGEILVNQCHSQVLDISNRL